VDGGLVGVLWAAGPALDEDEFDGQVGPLDLVAC
jgi:hypothetical protein